MHVAILLILGFTSFLFTLVLTPLAQTIGLRFGWVDRPDFGRKVHTGNVPRIGGVPIFVAYVTSYGVAYFLLRNGTRVIDVPISTVFWIITSAFLVFGVGLVDDIFDISPWLKLGIEALAGVIVIASGVRVTTLDGWALHPGLGSLVTFVWLIGCTNAVNLIDGVDGLASGIAFLATATMIVAASLTHQVGLAFATVPLAGVLLGFLRYNFNPASIFLGDSGSLSVGFLLGCYGVLWCEKSATMLGMTSPLIALAVPLLDAGLAILRRFLRQQPIFRADRAHIHHRLLARGFTARRVALTLYAAAGCASVLSLLMSRYHSQLGGAIIVLFAAGLVVGIQRLGYAEFGAARKLLLAGAFRRLLNGQITLDNYQQQLNQASTADECWRVVKSSAAEFGFCDLEMKLAGHLFTVQNSWPSNSWRIQIPLSDSDYLILVRSFGSPSLSNIATFADVLQSTLVPKIPLLCRIQPTTPHSVALSAASGR